MTEAVRFEHVSKWYGQVIGLSDVSFSLEPGVTGLLGANGSGKSTLIKLACGLLSPSLGEVSVLGLSPVDSLGVRRRIGLAADVDRFYESMTARQFVAGMIRLSGFSRRESLARAESSLVQFGLGEALDRRIGGFSKGMRQRTKLAQATAHEPDVLLLDEPLNGMDPLGRKDTIDLVRRLGEQGKTVLVSSHVLHEVEAMTPRILLIHESRLLAEGTVREIRALMEDRPSRVRIACTDARSLAPKLVAHPAVESVVFHDGSIEVLATKAGEFFGYLTELGAQPSAGILEIESLDESLQAVFDYLVK
jgi:ABC-2 type transport system ATP-binding protein